MLMVCLPFVLPGSNDLAAVLDVDAEEVGAGTFAEVLVTKTGFRAISGEPLVEVGTWGIREALGDGLSVPRAPMVRAVDDTASWEAFSRICRCFSSSLAKIGTKSSGMGLLSLNV